MLDPDKLKVNYTDPCRKMCITNYYMIATTLSTMFTGIAFVSKVVLHTYIFFTREHGHP